MEFCKCGSIKRNNKCTNNRCPEKDQKRRDWIADGMIMDFRKPVSYEEALDLAKRMKGSEKQV